MLSLKATDGGTLVIFMQTLLHKDGLLVRFLVSCFCFECFNEIKARYSGRLATRMPHNVRAVIHSRVPEE